MNVKARRQAVLDLHANPLVLEARNFSVRSCKSQPYLQPFSGIAVPWEGLRLRLLRDIASKLRVSVPNLLAMLDCLAHARKHGDPEHGNNKQQPPCSLQSRGDADSASISSAQGLSQFDVLEIDPRAVSNACDYFIAGKDDLCERLWEFPSSDVSTK